MKIHQDQATTPVVYTEIWPWAQEPALTAITGVRDWNYQRRKTDGLIEGIHWRRRGARVFYNLRLCQLWQIEAASEHRLSVDKYLDSLP